MNSLVSKLGVQIVDQESYEQEMQNKNQAVLMMYQPKFMAMVEFFPATE